MRWQDAEPGQARADCVMAPSNTKRHVYIKCQDDINKEFDKQDMKSPMVVEFHLKELLRGLFTTTFQIQYNDELDDSRTVSAGRVEHAVEDKAFMDICADEGLIVIKSGVEGWIVQDEDDFVDALDGGVGGVTGASDYSLRGAYLDYHERKGIRDAEDAECRTCTHRDACDAMALVMHVFYGVN